MDNQRRQELKRKYKEEQAKTDPNLYDFFGIKQPSTLKAPFTKEQIKQWSDHELEQNIIILAEVGIASAGKPSKNQNPVDWERVALLKLPLGIQAVFATYLFESSLSLNGSYFDFFLQNNGMFAIEALNGYKLMGNHKMVHVLEQCIGDYLILRNQEITDELLGVPHIWEIEESIFVEMNTKSFQDLDKEYRATQKTLYEELTLTKTQFIREHPDLFILTE